MAPLRISLLALAAALAACGSSERRPAAAPAGSEATHVHGLGVDPADGALYVATHTGLFRAGEGEERARRVGDGFQDTMGFTVVGAGHFLGSGHPDPRADLPPLLGLIESRDAGRTWRPVSLLGEADFHVLRASGRRVYGFDVARGRLLVSGDGGATWRRRDAPAPVIDLALDPADPHRALASTQAGLFLTEDAGRRWRLRTRDLGGLLAWTPEGLVLVDAAGVVRASPDGVEWTRTGDAGGAPAALAAHGRELLLALHTNEVLVSRDGGRSWTARARL